MGFCEYDNELSIYVITGNFLSTDLFTTKEEPCTWSSLLSCHITGNNFKENSILNTQLFVVLFPNPLYVELLRTFVDVTCGPRISTELVLY